MTMSSVAKIMPKPRASIARLVQLDIVGLEQAIDNTLSGSGRLLARAIDAGQAGNIAAADGQAAIDRIVAGIVAARTMRAEIVAAHGELRTIGNRVDLREMGWGDLVPSPASADAAPDTAPAVGSVA